jgi:hypothetical protein
MLAMIIINIGNEIGNEILSLKIQIYCYFSTYKDLYNKNHSIILFFIICKFYHQKQKSL